jgi:hypothetical protein
MLIMNHTRKHEHLIRRKYKTNIQQEVMHKTHEELRQCFSSSWKHSVMHKTHEELRQPFSSSWKHSISEGIGYA